jgi:hypothetical protein
MGEDTRGAFSEIRLVTGVVRSTSWAAKPTPISNLLFFFFDQREVRLTDVTGKDQEIVVGQSTVLVRVKQGISIEAIGGGVGLQHLQGVGIVLNLSLHGGTRCCVVGADRHFELKEGPGNKI